MSIGDDKEWLILAIFIPGVVGTGDEWIVGDLF